MKQPLVGTVGRNGTPIRPVIAYAGLVACSDCGRLWNHRHTPQGKPICPYTHHVTDWRGYSTYVVTGPRWRVAR